MGIGHWHEMWRAGRLAALLIFLGVALGAEAARADTIHFNDGMRTICQGRAWEEKDEVYCEFDGGLLVYPKTQVARIEKSGRQPASPSPPAESADHAPPQKQSAVTPRQPALAAPQAKGAPPTNPSSGVHFYNPRRQKKYWSSSTAHHDSYPEAISALAREFDLPVHWIEEQIGDSNDLEEIRALLASRRPSPADEARYPDAPATAGIVFYDPRRPQKYWTASDVRHNTYGEALEALAREFGGQTAWVESHMGDSNDVDTIRHTLTKARSAEKKQ